MFQTPTPSPSSCFYYESESAPNVPKLYTRSGLVRVYSVLRLHISNIASVMMEIEVVSERLLCLEPTRAFNIRLQKYVRAAACLLLNNEFCMGRI